MAERRARKPRRAELLAEVSLAGRALSTAAVMFHTALASIMELSVTEEKALDLLDRFGPLTAGELGRRSGLAPSSVSGLIDRLERKGFARRSRHSEDRRSVVVEIIRERLDGSEHYFAHFVGLLDELYATYSDEQLETILDFLNEAARRQREATARLSGADGESG